MCLAVPGKILQAEKIDNSRIGVVEFGGVSRQVYLDLVPEAEVGDYVIVHVGVAISRLDAEEAERTFELLEQMGVLEEEGLSPVTRPDAADPEINQ